MNMLIDFINMQWVANLGWSLLHTLWQGAFISITTLAILRLIPVSKSTLRYAISVGSMTTVVLLFVMTFIYLQVNNSNAIVFEQPLPSTLSTDQIHFIAPLPDSIPSLFASAVTFLNAHIYKIIIFWLVGASLLFIRLLGAFWYLERLRNNSTLLSGTVLEHLNQLAYQLQIPGWIDLAENKSIQSPMVIGFLKPIILVPAGMLTGLSAEQIESIFIHELTHIKRHDYFVNLIQSIIEVVLFFNPFVMILSNVLRKERENICDDVVLEKLNNPTLYAQTLAQLEEYKHHQLAISFAGNKNYLLNRIKRIMERTAKKQNGKGRFLPIILLVVGLISASWLSFSPLDHEIENAMDNNSAIQNPTILKADTIKPIEPNAKVPLFPTPIEPIEIDDMDFDEPLDFDHTFDMTFAAALEPVFNIDPFVFDIEPMEINTMFVDTIPAIQWEKFNEEFGKDFTEKFNAQYMANLSVMHESMATMEKALSRLNRDELITKEVEEKIRHIEMMQMEKLQHLEKLHQRDAMEKMQLAEEKMLALEKIQHEKLAVMEQKMKAFEKTMKEFEKELKEELVKDGYLKKGDEVNIHWKNGELQINDKKIKEKDQEKYKDLQEKYFKASDHYFKWE